MNKLSLLLTPLAFASAHLSAQVTIAQIDFNDSPSVDAAAAVDSLGYITNTAASVGYVTQSGLAYWGYDAGVAGDSGNWTQFKTRSFADLTEANYDSITLEYTAFFDMTNATTRGTKIRFGFQYDNGIDPTPTRMTEQGLLHVTTSQVRPDSYDPNTDGYNTLNPTNNWGLDVIQGVDQAVTMTTVIDFANDTVTYSYLNPNVAADGGTITYATYAFTGTVVNEVRIVLDAENNLGAYGFTSGAGEYWGADQLKITGVEAVPEPATFALFSGILVLGFILVRRRAK